ncbi:regulator of condensation, partial [Oesophagostomum dentatum]
LDPATITLHPVDNLPKRIAIKKVAMSSTHTVLLTFDNEIFAWGSNQHGQLGFGDTVDRPSPQKVETLKSKDVQSVAVGNGFSVFCCDRGTIMACGDHRLVGLGGNEDIARPALLDELLRVHVSELVCGSEHCLALTEEGEIFVWGNGEDGRLGTGKSEWISTPVQISTLDGVRVASCRAGVNASAVLTEDGHCLAMGNNQFNKLNLAHRQGFFTRERNDAFANILLPTMLKAFPARVIDVYLGEFHSGGKFDIANKVFPLFNI